MRTKLIFIALCAACFAVASLAQTNVSTNIIVPVFVEKTESILVSLQTILTSALAIVAAVLGVLAKWKNDQAKIVPVLIRAIEDHGSQPLKDDIQERANNTGVQAALHTAVQKVTANDKNDDAHPPDITTLPTPPLPPGTPTATAPVTP